MYTKYSRLFLQLACFTVFLFVSVSPVSAADKTKAKPAAKSTKASSTKSKSAKAKPTPLPPVVTEEAVRASFDVFTIEWMDKLSKTEEFHRTQQLKISQHERGFVAEYVGYLPQRFIEVKKTESKETPFVGMLTYYEKTLRCVGKTKEEAMQGPFEQAETIPVREIFRFTKGKWQY
jgi:hypothetical protein